ncbi:carbon-nitrogen hydrolase family protein [Bacillus thermotolerans]|uniref:Aliphatic amidase amiE n=1 Tax=Bacillus thermotolerans TaxID=1221996 RepID=A0A0F5HK71_BACTR|nr:carbon-nitrogen hydrolase family protein [Bacillus thermotolerans]KKB33445.1 Aliphatic amidase amiE [Bacillus thermotolerans]KKB37490.1 Aliphatic amidase amiE [Bacillus thermotolerans]KKB42152.1 Aliphatic amidase amiE [Bacillus thermotolerans]
MSYLNMAIVQAATPGTHPDPIERKKENLDKMLEYIDQVCSVNPTIDLICFPELYLNGLDTLNWKVMAESIPNGPSVQELMLKAQQVKKWIVPGSLCELGEDGKVYNTAMLISPQGEIVLKYRKVFIPYPLEPSASGNEFPIFEIPNIGKVGFLICADGHYPESARNLALKGAEVIIKPTLQGEWIGGLRNHTPVAITRAIENQCFVVSVNQPSPIGMGDSVAIDPEGRIIEQLGIAESFTFVNLNLEEVRRVRETGSCGMFGFLKMLKEFKEAGSNVDECYEAGIEHADVYKNLSFPHAKTPDQISRYERQKNTTPSR